MLVTTVSRPFAFFASLLFLCAAALLTVIGLGIDIHDVNYAAVYIGIGVWLECLFLAIHFVLRALLQSRANLADTISRVLAVIILLPIALDTLIQVVLIEQSIRSNGADVGTLVFMALVFLLLCIPGVFILRFVLGAAFRRRA